MNLCFIHDIWPRFGLRLRCVSFDFFNFRKGSYIPLISYSEHIFIDVIILSSIIQCYDFGRCSNWNSFEMKQSTVGFYDVRWKMNLCTILSYEYFNLVSKEFWKCAITHGTNPTFTVHENFATVKLCEKKTKLGT